MSRRKAKGPRPPMRQPTAFEFRMAASGFAECFMEHWEKRGWVVRVNGKRQFAAWFVEAWRRYAEEEEASDDDPR